MAVLKLRKAEAAQYDSKLDWRDLAVGRRLVFLGLGYDKPPVFEITAVWGVRRWRRLPGATVTSPIEQSVELRCGDEVRILCAAYVTDAARWALVRES